MALVTIQRSPSASSSPPSSEYGSSTYSIEEEPYFNRSLSEYYFAVKGFAVLLPKNECQQQGRRKKPAAPPDIQSHLQIILHLLRPGDTLQMAVRLESFHIGRIRYLVVVTTIGKQDIDESCLIGVDFTGTVPTIGLVLSVYADTKISLDGDGGFSVSSASRNHIYKPISVQAMWSALQTLHKESGKARDNHFYQGGFNHDWVGFYDKTISSDQSCINEWNAMDNLESRRPLSPVSLSDKEETKVLIRSKLKEIMMSVNIDDVTSKYIRQRLEEELSMDLFKYKSFIDQEMLTILGQMDSATEIFPHVYLGSEWNASNLEELKLNKVGFILNVTKEIDNFYPGMFDYLNIRVYDNEKTELLRHWDDTYKYISLVREKGSKVLVHCKMGISRSASVVIAYAMKAYNMSLQEATEIVKNKRTCIKPNQAFTSQLKIYQGILDASRQRHNALFRSKSETNLKSTVQNRLQQRSLHNPSITKSSGDAQSSELTIPDYKPKIDDKHISHLNVPGHSQRPKSWSPDEDTSRLVTSTNFDENEFGEVMQKCHSLNDQIWHAHVTIEQRHTDGTFLTEAVNGVLVPTTQHTEELQLSSSVKDRITEFESARDSSFAKLKNTNRKKHPEEFVVFPTTDCSSTDDLDFSNDSSTSNESESPDTKTVSPKLSPMSESLETELECSKQTEVVVPNESITWPTGIVKKQKEDFEGMVRDASSKSPLKSLARQSSSLSLGAIEESVPLQESEVVTQTPSRNNSWGSFDSAVVLHERDVPSRQNSWGSCDTRMSSGSLLSRNSSFGTFDAKTSVYHHDTDIMSTSSVLLKNKLNSTSHPIVEDVSLLNGANDCNRKTSRNDLEASEKFVAEEKNLSFVKQTRLKLETCGQDSQSLERSLSSGCMSPSKRTIERSASEKRPKRLSKMSSLKRFNSLLEKPKVHIVESGSPPTKTFLRSHSLERLGESLEVSDDKRLSAFSRLESCDRSNSQLLLDQLVTEAQAQIHELEKDQDEIKVKNLVDLFEVSKKESRGENTFPRRKVRPRSECAMDLPPVPQRKSSLDLHFRSPSNVTLRSSLRHPNDPSCQITIKGVIPKPPAPPSPTTRTCSNEVRRRKQQGKTHPLSKLAPRDNLL